MNYWIIELLNNWIIFKSPSPKSITQTYQNKKYVHILLRRISVQIHLNFLLGDVLDHILCEYAIRNFEFIGISGWKIVSKHLTIFAKTLTKDIFPYKRVHNSKKIFFEKLSLKRIFFSHTSKKYTVGDFLCISKEITKNNQRPHWLLPKRDEL